MERLRRVWRGAEPLWKTFWLYGVGGNMSFVAVIALAWAAGAPDGLPWLVWVLSAGWLFFVFRAIWRSADRYTGPVVWPLLARIGVCLGVPRLGAEAVLLLLA